MLSIAQIIIRLLLSVIFGLIIGIFIKKEVYDAFVDKQQKEEFQKQQKEQGFHNITIDISEK
jgi:uncharacterized membrane protein YraQ (UPF0718 family)